MKSFETLLKEIEEQGVEHPLLKEGFRNWMVSECILFSVIVGVFFLFVLIFFAVDPSLRLPFTQVEEDSVKALYGRTQSHLCALQRIAEKEKMKQLVAETDLNHPAELSSGNPSIPALQEVLHHADWSILFDENNCRSTE